MALTQGAGRKVKAIRELVDKYSDVIQIEVLSFSRATNDLFDTFGVQNGGCYLVRPDMYIAYRSARFDEEHLKTFLKRIAIMPSATPDRFSSVEPFQ